MARPLHRTPQLPAATPQCVAEIVLLRLILLEKQAALAHDRNGSKPEKLNASTCFPLCPRERTPRNKVGTSVSCHLRKSFMGFARQPKSLVVRVVNPRKL